MKSRSPINVFRCKCPVDNILQLIGPVVTVGIGVEVGGIGVEVGLLVGVGILVGGGRVELGFIVAVGETSMLVRRTD